MFFQLFIEKEDQVKRINSLVLQENNGSSDIPTSEELKRSDLYLELTAKLAANTRKLEELDDKSSLVQKEWSDALANAEFSKKALEDMQTNFSKRWAELTEEKSDKEAAEEEGGSTSGIVRVENIITLQHKLTQALENVRQAETSRKTLDEAVLMNSSLQAKVEEFKSKYNALQVEKAARASSSASGSNSNQNSSNSAAVAAASLSATGSSSTPKAKSSSSSASAPASVHSTEKVDRSIDKLHRDYKRARKELAATTASKDAAKAKLERTEKEKDFLSMMNSRLLKQASEKDEINAKSLSTILHLKQLTEQITKEKDNLEQQAKSAEQLALAARLASNARDRLGEEFSNEQKRLQIQLDELEQKCAVLANEKEVAEAKLSQEKARMSGLISDAQKAKKRCEELAIESTKVQEERQKVIESLAIAKREASEATHFSHQLAESQGGGLVGGFTADQLNTQVSHLKNRLICPVCNVRDKKCILLRCRHMFCRSCVDESVKNRSRKCPACGGRFDTKDIADVWL
jgi:E3 ubiquitin-protein ligase BRE1